MLENDNVKISVIVPVYNVDKYLTQCLESILSSPADYMEVICVNDGSADGSADILEDFRKKDARIHVVTQKNRGLSAARNRGVSCARGEYIIYIDSDDYVLTDRFQEILNLILHSPGIDLFVTDYQMVAIEGGHLRKKEFYQIGERRSPMYGLDNLPKVLEKRQCFWNVWRFVYRKDFLERNQISFREGCLCEDIDYTTSVLLAEPTTEFVHCPFYCYRVGRAESLMGHITPKRVTDAVNMLRESIEKTVASSVSWKQAVIGQYQFELFLILAQLFEVNTSERKSLKKSFKETLPVLKLGNDCFAHTAYRVISFIGITSMSYVLSLSKKQRRKARKTWKPAEECGGHKYEP